MTTDQKYGHIELQNDKIVRTLNGQLMYEILVTDIKVIGEFTTASGPIFDDWFLTLITANSCYEIPMDVIGIDKLLSDLGQKLGTNLSYKFANSAYWKTRIMYPINSIEKNLYERVSQEPKTSWDRIMKIIGLQGSVIQYSNETEKILKA
jgi:hypothetical protein